jgi:hypothetical protein
MMNTCYHHPELNLIQGLQKVMRMRKMSIQVHKMLRKQVDRISGSMKLHFDEWIIFFPLNR